MSKNLREVCGARCLTNKKSPTLKYQGVKKALREIHQWLDVPDKTELNTQLKKKKSEKTRLIYNTQVKTYADK